MCVLTLWTLIHISAITHGRSPSDNVCNHMRVYRSEQLNTRAGLIHASLTYPIWIIPQLNFLYVNRFAWLSFHRRHIKLISYTFQSTWLIPDVEELCEFMKVNTTCVANLHIEFRFKLFLNVLLIHSRDKCIACLIYNISCDISSDERET